MDAEPLVPARSGGDAGDVHPGLHRLCGEMSAQHPVQLGAVQRHHGRTQYPLHCRTVPARQPPPGTGAQASRTLHRSQLAEPGSHAQLVERPQRVRHQGDAGTDGVEPARLVEDGHPPPRAAQADGGTEPADARAHYHRVLLIHYPRLSRLYKCSTDTLQQ